MGKRRKLTGPKTSIAKHPDPLALIREAARAGALIITRHAHEEMQNDGITLQELKQSLINGKRNPRKDLIAGTNWRYAIEGWTGAADRMLRVPCSISIEEKVIVVTAMEIMKAGERR